MPAGNLGIDELDINFWSATTTVITWIQQEDNCGAFVHNRVQEIRRLSDNKSWRHIAGTMNPADTASRGCSAEVLHRSKWGEGPEWHKKSPSKWPVPLVHDKFLYNCQHPENKTCEIDATELGNVEEHLIKLIQKESFHGITDACICFLMHFEDEHEILRIETRISEC
ncbi:hypothetical protein PR048_012725 [Dryococelus australis]|uniref:Uncharacterized protein n=1 Tax=Dryococelus australis TaxID=614101 RepID=A0ABQ9HQ63_9NEOP|nr:hypothetical protein PR048_012725 [Dryococelus australis]